MFVPVLYSDTYNNKQARTVFYEFTMGNMYEVLGSKAKLWRSGAKTPAARGNRWSVFGEFCSFLIAVKYRILRHI